MLVIVLAIVGALAAAALAAWLGYRIGFNRGGQYGFVLGQSSAITEMAAARKRWERPQ